MPPVSRSPGILDWAEKARAPVLGLAAIVSAALAWRWVPSPARFDDSGPMLLVVLLAVGVSIELLLGARAAITRRRALLGLACLIAAPLLPDVDAWSDRLRGALLLEGLLIALWSNLRRRAVADSRRALRRMVAAGAAVFGDAAALLVLVGWRFPFPSAAQLAWAAALAGLSFQVIEASRARRTRHVAGQDRPCLRFGCPRCGAEEDFARGPSPCGECGLLVRVEWQLPEGEIAALEAEARPEREVLYACPHCRDRARWPAGIAACRRCGTPVHVRWNRV